MEGDRLAVIPEIWPKEQIPHNDNLFRRVHFGQMNRDTKKVTPAGFSQKWPDLSCDWDKYSNVEAIRSLISQEEKTGKPGQKKNPDLFTICTLTVGLVVNLSDVEQVCHNPIQNEQGVPDNRAHSLIMCIMEGSKGKQKVKARSSLYALSTVVYLNDNAWERWKNGELT